jgi:hypothetical protein
MYNEGIICTNLKGYCKILRSYDFMHRGEEYNQYKVGFHLGKIFFSNR